MVKGLLLAAAVLAIAASASGQGRGARLATCLHGRNETAEQRDRREKAVKVAHAINTAEVIVVGPPKPRYRRPEELRFIPALPRGFELQFDTDGETYTFSIKDTLDACHFAIFSDQEKFVYTGTPLAGPRVVPVGTK